MPAAPRTRFFRRETVIDLLQRLHLQVGADLIVQLPLGATAMDQTANDKA